MKNRIIKIKLELNIININLHKNVFLRIRPSGNMSPCKLMLLKSDS